MWYLAHGTSILGGQTENAQKTKLNIREVWERR